jgi:molecular chaperone HtpG
MTPEELEGNLGTIAKSGSFDFKRENKDDDIDIIGQFGVGFYSAFMVADKITVKTKPYGAEIAYKWESEGADGYTVTECDKESFGTEIILNIKADTDDEKYSEFLEEYASVSRFDTLKEFGESILECHICV